MPATATTDNTSTTTASAPSSSAMESLEKVSARDTASSAASTASTGSGVSPGQSGSSTTATTAAASPSTSTTKDAPESRIETAVKNARAALQAEHDKAIAEVTAKLKALEWAREYKADEVSEGMRLRNAINTDANGVLTRLQEIVRATSTKDPEPDLVSQDGKHKAFSADAVRSIIANTEARIKAAVMAELQPTVKFATDAQRRAEAATLRNQSMEFAKGAIAEIKAQPWFKPDVHGPKLMAKLNAMTPDEQLRLGGTYGALMRANQLVLIEEWPTLQLQVQSDVEADNRRKAAASTGTVTGNGHAGTTAKRPTSVEELSAHLASKAAAMGGVA